jgi:hypothetical protein
MGRRPRTPANATVTKPWTIAEYYGSTDLHLFSEGVRV